MKVYRVQVAQPDVTYGNGGLRRKFFTRYPKPERAAVPKAGADNADGATATLGDGLTDGETHTSALHKLVQLHETLKHGGLLVQRNALTSVLAVDVEAVHQLLGA